MNFPKYHNNRCFPSGDQLGLFRLLSIFSHFCQSWVFETLNFYKNLVEFCQSDSRNLMSHFWTTWVLKKHPKFSHFWPLFDLFFSQKSLKLPVDHFFDHFLTQIWHFFWSPKITFFTKIFEPFLRPSERPFSIFSSFPKWDPCFMYLLPLFSDSVRTPKKGVNHL